MAKNNVLALTEAIYDAAAGDTPWTAVERGLKSLIGAGTATLLAGDYATGRIELLWREGFSGSDIALYQGHYRHLDRFACWLERLVRDGAGHGFRGLRAMALPADLRERVLAAHVRREGGQRVPAERFGVALGAVNGWLRQAREGRRAPLARRGGRPPPGGTDPAVLAEPVARRPDATPSEYAEMPAERAGRRFSLPALRRALRRAGPRRKKRRRTRASRSGPTSSRPGPPGGPRSWGRPIPAASSPSTGAASTPA